MQIGRHLLLPRARTHGSSIVANPSLVDSQGGRLGKVSRAGSRPRSRRFSLRLTRSRHRRNRGWWGWRQARSSLRRGSSGESDTGPEVPISPRGRGPVFSSDLGKRRLTGSEILMTAPISVNDGWVAGRGEEDATRRRRDDDKNNGGGHGRGDGRGDGETTATVSRGAPQWGGSCAGTTTATTTTMA